LLTRVVLAFAVCLLTQVWLTCSWRSCTVLQHNIHC